MKTTVKNIQWFVGAVLACVTFAVFSATAEPECKVPNFTATSEIDGKIVRIDTSASKDNCTLRARKLAYYGKWRADLVAEENALYASKWIQNGEAEAREMADYMAKTNGLSASVDLLAGWAKGAEKLIFADERTTRLIAVEATKIVAKTIKYGKDVLELSGKEAQADIAGLTADTLNLLATTASCIDKRDVVGCGKTVKEALKTQKSFGKVFGKKLLDKNLEAQITGWIEFVLDAAQAAQSVGKLSVAASASSGYTAVASLIDVTAKASTGEYWKDKSSDPQYFDEYIMAVASSTSNWMKCKGAAISLVDEQKKFIGNTADCVSSTVKVAVDNMSRLMSRSTVLYSASQDVYNAKKLQIARMLFDERFKYQSFNDLFQSYGILISAKDRNPQLIEKYSLDIGYNYRLELGRVLQVWSWQRYGDEVATVMDRYALAMFNDARALESGTLNPQNYAKNSLVRFAAEVGGVKTVALLATGNISWNASTVLKIDSNVMGIASAAYARLTNVAGRQLTNTALTQAGTTASGAVAWWKNVENETDWQSLADGIYSLKVAAVGEDKVEVSSPAITLSIKRDVQIPPLKGNLTSAVSQDTIVNSSVTIAGTASGREPVAVKITFYPPNNVPEYTANATRNAQAGTWSLSQPFYGAGVFPYVVKVSDASGAAAIQIGSGKVTVAETLRPVPPPVTPSVKAFSFTPSSIKAGATVDFAAQTNTRVSSMRLMFDVMPGGASVALLNPSGDGVTWEKKQQPISSMGTVANGYNRSVWALAQPAGGGSEVASASQFLRVEPATVVAPPALTDGMKFEGLETVPDNSVINAGQWFTKTWTVRNSGTTTWNSSYCLKPAPNVATDTPLAPAATSVCVQNTVAPNGTYKFEVQMTAPAARDALAIYKQTWALMHGQNNLGALTAVIKVNALPPRVSPPPVPPIPPVPPVAPVPPVPPVPAPGANVQSISPLTGALGKTITFTVTGTQLVPSLQLTLTGERCSASAGTTATQRTYDCTVTNVGSKTVTIATTAGTVLKSSVFTVISNNVGVGNPVPPVQPPTLPTSLVPQLTAGSSIPSGQAWLARLRTNVPIYSADLIFATGTRIPFDGDATAWETRDINSKLYEAGTFSYTLQVRRTASSQIESFPGGTLEVRAPIIPVNQPTITSASSSVQGTAYNLTVSTAANADRVMVQWPDVPYEQGLGATNAQRTQFAFGNKLFSQVGAVNYTVKTYKDGVTAPTGQVTGVLNITAQAASLQLLDISKNIIVGESPFFTVEASLAVARVAVQIGNNAAVNLVGTGPGSASQSFRAKVLVNQVGSAVPYTITGYNAQGQAVGNRVTGTMVVAGVSDSLNAPTPVPAVGVSQGEYVNWRFGTNKQPDQMWMEFSAPIGNVQLEGAFFKHSFNYPVGTYKYKLMRKDGLGNVYPITGASGDLVIKPKVDTGPLIKQITINGQKVSNGGTVQLKLSGGLEALVDAPTAKGIVFKLFVQPFGEVKFNFSSNSNGVWRSDASGFKLNDYLRGLVQTGNASAKIYLGTGGTDINTNLGGTVDFTVQLVP